MMPMIRIRRAINAGYLMCDVLLLLLWMLMLMLMLMLGMMVMMIVKGVRRRDLMLCVMLYVGVVTDLVGNDYASQSRGR
jgi:hypothetical protein